MAGNPLCRPGRSNYRSKDLALNGFQCQFDISARHREGLQSLLDLLSDMSGWQRLPFPTTFSGYQEGVRKEINVSKIRESGLPFGEWLEGEPVFSYAFTYRDRLNYTVLQ